MVSSEVARVGQIRRSKWAKLDDRTHHGFTPVDEPGRRPLQVCLMALGHMLMYGGVPVSRRAARMGGDALAGLEQFDGGRGVASFELLTGELIRNAVVMPVDLDVLIDVGADGIPF